MTAVIRGVDVSMHQGKIDWQKVRSSGIQFAICKVSEGIPTKADPNPVDPDFARNWKGIRDAGMVRGAYVFSRPQPGRNPATEVITALKAINGAGGLRRVGDLPLCMDIEWSSGLSESELEEWVMGWIRVAKQKTGQPPIIYTGAWWRDHGLDIRIKNRLWLAAYVTHPDHYVPKPSFGKWWLWQKSSSGSVPGINGNVDLNVFKGELPDLKKVARLKRKPEDVDSGTGGVPAPRPAPAPKPPAGKPPKKKPQRPRGAPKSLPIKFYDQWRAPWKGMSSAFKDWCWDHGFVSPHFTRQEWACKCGTPVPSSLRGNAQRHAENLEKFRHEIGDIPIPFISAFRPDWYNRQIGGATSSQHIKADATDFDRALVDKIGRAKFLRAAEVCFRNGGVGIYPGGSVHLDSRGYRARWSSW